MQVTVRYYGEGEEVIRDQLACSQIQTKKAGSPGISQIQRKKAGSSGISQIQTKIAGSPGINKVKRSQSCLPGPSVKRGARENAKLTRLATNQGTVPRIPSKSRQSFNKTELPVGKPTQCREKAVVKEVWHGETIGQALIIKPRTIKEMLHNRTVHSKYNEGHEDDLFGQSKSQAGYAGLKKRESHWDGKLISKEDTSGDESSCGESSDGDETELGRARSPSGWSLACQPPTSPADDTSGTPAR